VNEKNDHDQCAKNLFKATNGVHTLESAQALKILLLQLHYKEMQDACRKYDQYIGHQEGVHRVG